MVADAVEVEERYLKRFGVFLDRSEDGGIDGCSDENESVGCEHFVFRDEGFERLDSC